MSLKFFEGHSTEHQICNTSEITKDRKRFSRRTTASLYLWPICYCEFNCSYPVLPPEIRIHTDYAHYTLIYAAERIPTDNVELEFVLAFFGAVPHTSNPRSSYQA